MLLQRCYKMQRYISIFGRLLVTDSLHQWHGAATNNSAFSRKVNNIKYFSQTIKNHNQPNRIPLRKAFNINDLFQHINNGKIYYLKQLTNVLHTIQFEKLQADEAILLLKCCGSVVPDSSREQRNIVCQDVFKGLQSVNNINTGILNRYVQTCTENSISIYSKELLVKVEPNRDTYKLLLENICQFGCIEDAFQILEIMKNKQIPLDNDGINSLILAHTLNGGLKSAEAVLNTLRIAQISENNNAKLAIFKGLIRRGNLDEFKVAVERYPLALTEVELLDFIEELGLNGLKSWLIQVNIFYKHISITRDFQTKIEKICIHLVHMKQPKTAMDIYEMFVEPHPDMAFGFTLLKEMLHCNTDMSTIISIAKSLVEKELNPYILESLTEIALKFKYEEEAWILLKSLVVVRPHYFWPLLIQSGKKYGENGVLSALKRIKEFNIKLDAETLELHVFPYCDLSNAKLLMLKLQEINFNVREIFSPLLTVFLKQNKMKAASELCRLYNVNISGEGFLPLLAKSWMFSKDPDSALVLLARYCESNISEEDLVGTFLINAANFCISKDNVQEYLKLIEVIGKNRLKISSNSADILEEIFAKVTNSNTQKELNSTLHSLVDFGLNLSEGAVIPHPRTMDLNGLECHLIELQEKNMGTRGVLRRLIQMHAGKGNVQRVTELRQLFVESGYEESPGIKSSIMHNYVLGGYLEEAIILYYELKRLFPDFQLDSFKFIDLVRLLIDKDEFEEGHHILHDEISTWKEIGNTSSIERNCRNLLNACKNAEQLDKIFILMSENGVCKISNVMLGPLIRIYLKSGDIDKAVERYIELSKKHKCTPLQFEVLSVVAKQQDSDKLEQVLRATEAVHGPIRTQVGLIAALAENGQENALKNILIKSTFQIEGLLRNRCKRWIEERKIEPLKCLATACGRLPQKIVDVDFIYKCIFDICGKSQL